MEKIEFKLRETEIFDIRTVDRHIERGLTTRADYDAQLEALEDCAHLARPSNVHFIYNGRAPEQEVIVTPEMVSARIAEENRERDSNLRKSKA